MKTVLIVAIIGLIFSIISLFLVMQNVGCGNMPGSMCWGLGWKAKFADFTFFALPISLVLLLISSTILTIRSFSKGSK